MTENDDTSPSEPEGEASTEGASEEGGDGIPDGPGDKGDGADDQDGPGFSLPKPESSDEEEDSDGQTPSLSDRLARVSSDATDERDDSRSDPGSASDEDEPTKEIEEIPEEAIEPAGDLAEPSSSPGDDGPEETGGAVDTYEEPDAEPAGGALDEEDEEIIDLDVEDSDLIVEAGAFEEAREEAQQDEATAPDAEYDVGPTVVSDDHVPDDAAGEDDENESRISTGLGEISKEMESAEEAGELEESSAPAVAEETLEEQGAGSEAPSERLGNIANEMEEAEQAGELAAEETSPEDATVVDESARPEEAELEGNLHGEAQLDLEAEGVNEDDFEYDEYEETVITEEGFDFDDTDVPEASAAAEVAPPEAGGAPQSAPDPGASATSGEGAAGSADLSHSAPPAEADEFDDQETELFERGAPGEGAPAVLEVMTGPEAGRTITLNSDRVEIGRSTENDASIRDEAMSRQHFEIVRDSDGTYRVEDLDSVNGTLLNGTPIEESNLFEGDRVEAGKTILEFQDPEPTVSPSARERQMVPVAGRTAEPHKPSRTTEATSDEPDGLVRWLNRITVAAAVLMIPLAGLFTYFMATSDEEPRASVQKRSEARQAYLAAVDAMRTRDWEAAEKNLERAKRLNPELPELDERLDEVRTERAARSALEKARKAAESGDTERARQLAREIPEGSVYAETARDLVRRQRREEHLDALHNRAREQFDDGEPDEALTSVERILERAPYHAEALALRHRILEEADVDPEAARERAKEAETEAPPSRDEEGDGAETVSEGGEPSTEDDASEDSESSWLIDDFDDETENKSSEARDSVGSGTIDFQRGYALYNQGRFEAAIAHFRDASRNSSGSVSKRAEKLVRNIRTFQNNFEAGKESLKSGKWGRAVRKFRAALGADKSVASAQYFKSELNTRIAEAKANKGLAQFKSGNYTKAFESYQSASQYDGSHAKVRSLLRKLDEKATSMYIRAKTKRKTDPRKAASICRTIMEMVPESNDSYKKAEKLLQNI